MDSIASVTIETGGPKDHMNEFSKKHYGDVMPSSCYSEKMLWIPSSNTGSLNQHIITREKKIKM